MQEIDSPLPGTACGTPASHRHAPQTALGAGFAASVLPIAAQTVVHTPADGLAAGSQILDVEGATLPFYYAMPAGKKNLPVVLVVQEIFGVHAHIADVCRRFAQAGYLAIAPDLYVRQGDPSSYTDIPKLLADIVYKVPDAQVMGDLDAVVAWAQGHGGNTQRLGITGFCWGGRITWLYAAHNRAVKAGVAWYGRLVGVASPLAPRHPVALATDLKAPVLGLYGGQDEGIPLTTVHAMKEALAAAAAQGNPAAAASAFVVFPQAPHAFYADYRPSYRPDAAKEGWTRALAWFQAHGV